MHPRQNSIGYQKQKCGAQTESDSITKYEEHTNKQYFDGNYRIEKAHQLNGRTFVIISPEIVDKLCIHDDTWFQPELGDNRIVLRILDWNDRGALNH